MRVALPIWDGRVSPVFDVAQELLVADVKDHAVGAQATHVITETGAGARAKMLGDLGVSVLICGAISQALEHLLLWRGVRVISRRCGEATEILEAYLAGRLDEPRYLMPGCQADDQVPTDSRWAHGRTTASDEAEVTCCDQIAIHAERMAAGQTETALRWIAAVGTHQVGELHLNHDQTEGRIRRFQIDPDWQHSPAPCRLLQEALSYGRRLGLVKVTVEAPITTQRAIQLFACLGFQRNPRRSDGHHQPAFYLNLYRTVDEARCMRQFNEAASTQ